MSPMEVSDGEDGMRVEGGVEGAVGVEAGEAGAVGAVGAVEAAADEEFAVGLLGEGEDVAHAEGGGVADAGGVEGGVEGAVGVEAHEAAAGGAIVGGEDAADVEFVAGDGEDLVDLGLALGVGEGGGGGVEAGGGVEGAVRVEPFEGGLRGAGGRGLVAGDIAAGDDFAVGLEGDGVDCAGAGD